MVDPLGEMVDGIALVARCALQVVVEPPVKTPPEMCTTYCPEMPLTTGVRFSSMSYDPPHALPAKPTLAVLDCPTVRPMMVLPAVMVREQPSHDGYANKAGDRSTEEAMALTVHDSALEDCSQRKSRGTHASVPTTTSYCT